MKQIKLLEMSKYYKVHIGFDLDHGITQEEPCRCSAPFQGRGIFSNITEVPAKRLMALEKYNGTMNGTVFSSEHIEWEALSRSQCQA